MAANRPTILVVAPHRSERAVIATALRQAGFAVVARASGPGSTATAAGGRWALALIAVAGEDGAEILHRLRRRQPEVKTLAVIEPSASLFRHEVTDAVIVRPLDVGRLLGHVFALLLRDDETAGATHLDHAELGIAAAKLACLANRRSAAAAAGARRLAHELTRQIGETRSLHRRLLAGTAVGGPASIG